MSDTDSARNGTEGRPGTGGVGGASPLVPELALRIVEYDGRPDRATIHPADPDETCRLEAWVSLDADAVVELSAYR